jgi:hypothetical protein
VESSGISYVVKTQSDLLNLSNMTAPTWTLLRLSSLACCLFAASAIAEPIDFSEVSLLVRAHESEPSIVQEVSSRKLVRTFTQQQEETLRSQGAKASLIQALRAPATVLNAADASAFEARRDQNRKMQKGADAPRLVADTDESESSEQLHIFEVAPGYPINLSQWGGPDYDFAFNAPTRLDEGREDAVMIDNVRTGTHVATYLGAGRPDDSTTIFDRRNYVSVMDHSFSRALRIDRTHPVSMKGSPYTLYPVYAAGGVSLYYIGGSSHSVKLAVSTSARR